jgi:putative component of membrane protein insertase Oxa1/YidC/SpoIIIJ protein YidD
MAIRIRTLLITAVALPIAVAALAIDPQAAALEGIHAYQHALAPVVARLGVRCRMTPTCSRYAEVVIARDGLARGGLKTVRRLARCGLWTRAATRDEP